MAETFMGKPCKNGHDGLRYVSQGMCVHCSKAWYQANKERLSVQWQERKEQVKERKAARARSYYLENREKLLAQQRDYYERNRLRWKLKAHKRRSRGEPTHVSVIDLRRLAHEQRGKCAVCRLKLKKYHLDHITPLSRGGRHEFTNLQLLCSKCNLHKHAKDPIDFMQSRGFLL